MLDASFVRGGLSRCVRRRRARALHVNEWAEAAVETLNEMQGGPQQHRQANIHASAGQRAFVSRLRLAVAEIGPPPSDVTEEGALRALLSKQGYAGESATLAPIDVNLLSLPGDGHVLHSLPKLLGKDGAVLVDGLRAKMLPKEETKDNIKVSGLKKP